MRAILPVILAIAISACGQRNKTTQYEKISIEQSPNQPQQPAVTSAIYQTDIPDSIHAQLKKYLPGWALPDPDSWEKFWFDEYLKNGNLVNYVAGQFNTDGVTDYAFILANSRGEFDVWAILSDNPGYKVTKVHELGERSGKLDVGLDLIKKGKLQYIDLESDTEPQPIDLKTEALQVSAFERAATTYYWENGELKSVTTGD